MKMSIKNRPSVFPSASKSAGELALVNQAGEAMTESKTTWHIPLFPIPEAAAVSWCSLYLYSHKDIWPSYVQIL